MYNMFIQCLMPAADLPHMHMLCGIAFFWAPDGALESSLGLLEMSRGISGTFIWRFQVSSLEVSSLVWGVPWRVPWDPLEVLQGVLAVPLALELPLGMPG